MRCASVGLPRFASYRQTVRKHFDLFFSGKALEAIEPDLIEGYMAAKRREGLASKDDLQWAERRRPLSPSPRGASEARNTVVRSDER